MPTVPAMSIPRCCPAAYGSSPLRYDVSTSPSTGHGQSPAAWAAGVRERANAATMAVTTDARTGARRRRWPTAGSGLRMRAAFGLRARPCVGVGVLVMAATLKPPEPAYKGAVAAP